MATASDPATTCTRWSWYSCDLLSCPEFCLKINASFLIRFYPKPSRPLLALCCPLCPPAATSMPQPWRDRQRWWCSDVSSLRRRALVMRLLNEPLSSGVLILYVDVKFDSSHLWEVPVSSGKDETDFFLGQLSQILSRSEVLSHWEGCQISLLFSLGENSSGPRAISAQFCGFNFRASTPASALPARRCWTAIRGAADVAVGEGWVGAAQAGGRRLEMAISCDRSPCLLFPKVTVSAFHPTQPRYLQRQGNHYFCWFCLPCQSKFLAWKCEIGFSLALRDNHPKPILKWKYEK